MIQATAARYYVGLDLGQKNDFTALAILERAELQGGFDYTWMAHKKVVEHRIRHLERVKLGTPYPEVVRRVREVTRSGELRGQCQLIVDATGVGQPVVDLLREADLDCRMRPVIITGGDLERMEGGYYRVPKRDLVTGVQVMLERGELKIAAGIAEGELLVKEMAEMRVKVTLSGREQYGAWREGTHDDMVLAVALACWGVKKEWPYPLEGVNALWMRGPGNVAGWWLF